MKNATIAVFAKEPVPGTVKTRLIPPLDDMQAAGFAGALLCDTINMVDGLKGSTNKELYYYPSSGAGYFEKVAGPGWTLKLQEGKSLGERLSAAFDNIINKNGSPAIIIGTDSPGLPTSFISASIKALKKYDIVLGPSSDGGFYLVGASGYFPLLLENIRWSTSSAYGDIIRNTNSLRLKPHILPEWSDIDNFDDLLALNKKIKDMDKNFWHCTKKFLSDNNFTRQLLSKP